MNKLSRALFKYENKPKIGYFNAQMFSALK